MTDPVFVQHQKEMRQKAEWLRALAHPIRLCILEKLVWEGEKNVTEIVSCMDASQSNISQHLRKLRDQGLVAAEKRENLVYYSCSDEPTRQMIRYLFERRTP